MRYLNKRGVIFFSSCLLSMSACVADNGYWNNNNERSEQPRHYNQQHKNPVQIEIINDEGDAFRKHQTRHEKRTHRAYLEAKKGRYYQLRVTNRSNKRVALVLAVDGRNILTGKKSYLSNKERMYVLAPYQTATYKGWRTGKNKVNRFYFTTAGDSYSAAWGDYSAMGVIAAAVYNEKPVYRQPPVFYQKQGKADRAAKSRASVAPESSGTGFGHEEYSASRQVEFRAKNKVAAKYFYKYEWRSSLCQRGVIRCYKQPKDRFLSKGSSNNRLENQEYVPYPPHYYNR